MQDAAALRQIKSRYRVLAPLMDERMRRQWAATEAQTYGRGGVSAVSSATGMSCNTIRKGHLYFDSNHGPIEASTNNVGGNLQAFQTLGGVNLTYNTITGNLQCKANVPAPTGGGNRATSKEDQCSRL